MTSTQSRYYARSNLTGTLTGDNKVDKATLRHETKHADQWAIGGIKFAAAYNINAGLTGNDPCKNIFEWWAGFKDGGYSKC